MKTRAEHLEWCKKRARERSEHELASNVLEYFFSDLDAHSETAGNPGPNLWLILTLPSRTDMSDVLKFIDDYK